VKAFFSLLAPIIEFRPALEIEARDLEVPLNDEAREKIGQIKEEELARLIKILGWYTLKEIRSRKLFFRTGRSGEMPGGYDVESIVNEAFTRVLTGQRRWNPNQDPDLKKYLMNVIDSILSHLATGKDNEMVRAAGVPEGNDDDSQWEAGSKERRPEREWLSRGSQRADDELIEREMQEEEERVLQMLVEECGSDPVLARVLQVKREFDAEPAEISELTGIPVKDVYNAIKRLDRKIALIRRRLDETK
jgi:DNA-directed RNA polymerase specialized sigma24 family protein